MKENHGRKEIADMRTNKVIKILKGVSMCILTYKLVCKQMEQKFTKLSWELYCHWIKEFRGQKKILSAQALKNFQAAHLHRLEMDFESGTPLN